MLFPATQLYAIDAAPSRIRKTGQSFGANV